MDEERKTDLQVRDPALPAVASAETGLLLHSSAGYTGLALLPGRVRPWAALWSSAPPAVFSALTLLLAGATPAGVLAAIALGAASWFGARWLVPHQLRLLARLRAREDSPDALAPGAVVRLRGRVRARSSFPAAVTGRAAVLARYEIRGERSRPQRRIRGVDFEVETETGLVVAVPAEDVFLDAPLSNETTTPRDISVLGRPAAEQWGSPYEQAMARPGAPITHQMVTYREAVLSAGDDVEISGTLVREVDLTGPSDGSSRVPPMRLALRAGFSMPVFVRRLST